MFVSDYLGVNSQQLFQAIKANETTYGSWMATVSQDLMNALNLQVAYVGTLETEESHCHPLFEIKSQTRTGWSYQNKVCHCWIPSSTVAIQHKIGIQIILDKVAALHPVTETFERTVLACLFIGMGAISG